MVGFDWHADVISRDTVVNDGYKSSQNVRRFMVAQCGAQFNFDRAFMLWIKDGTTKTMGDVVDEWVRRNT